MNHHQVIRISHFLIDLSNRENAHNRMTKRGLARCENCEDFIIVPRCRDQQWKIFIAYFTTKRFLNFWSTGQIENYLIGVLMNVIIDKFSFCLISSVHANPIFEISFWPSLNIEIKCCDVSKTSLNLKRVPNRVPS